MGNGGALKGLLFVTSIGITMVVSILLGLVIGVYLDRKFATKPWFTIIFLTIGIAAGFKNIYDTMKKYADKNNQS